MSKLLTGFVELVELTPTMHIQEKEKAEDYSARTHAHHQEGKKHKQARVFYSS